jgi:hypothetical protein
LKKALERGLDIGALNQFLVLLQHGELGRRKHAAKSRDV